MSSPECPPFNPFSEICMKKSPSGASSFSKENVAVVFLPPAHDTNICPSSSESRFMSISPVMNPAFMPIAPVSPVSSSRVKTHSIGPCSMSSLARIASSIATPIPSSAPSVVPFAPIHSPSTYVCMASLWKSKSTSTSFSHTISMWLCSINVLRFSYPEVAGLRISTLPVSSVIVSRP